MKTLVRPSHFHAVSALDVGFVDGAGWLSAYIDYAEGCIVVEDEFLLFRASTQDLADAIEAHERALYGPDKHAGGHKQPHARVSDVDHRLIADLRQQHSLDFRAIERKNFAADINLVNVLIGGKQLLVSEKCERLRRQLREGVYNRTRKDMAADAQGGHNDLLAALRYLCRTAEPLLRRNPFPAGWRLPKDGPNVWRRAEAPDTGLLPRTALGRRLARGRK